MRFLVLALALTACATQPAQLPTKAGAKAELVFEKEIQVFPRSLKVDGKDFPVTCQKMPDSSGQLEATAVLVAPGGTRIELICIDDYLGGMQLKIPGVGDHFHLASLDGDAGDLWDSRALVTREKGALRIERVNLMSASGDESGTGKVQCIAKQTAHEWKNGNFAEVGKPKKFTHKEFTPPIHVARECLAKNGRWKN